MVFSPPFLLLLNFCPFYVNIVDYSTVFEVFLMISSEPIGRGTSKYAKILSNKSFHLLSNQIEIILTFLFTII